MLDSGPNMFKPVQHSFVVKMLVGAFNKMKASVEAFTGYCGNFCEISLRAELWCLGAECGGWIRLGCGQRPTPTPATVSGHKMQSRCDPAPRHTIVHYHHRDKVKRSEDIGTVQCSLCALWYSEKFELVSYLFSIMEI